MNDIVSLSMFSRNYDQQGAFFFKGQINYLNNHFSKQNIPFQSHLSNQDLTVYPCTNLYDYRYLITIIGKVFRECKKMSS